MATWQYTNTNVQFAYCTLYIFDPDKLILNHLKWIFRKQPITSRFEQFKCNNSRFFASFGIRLHIRPQGQPIRCHRLFPCCCSSSHAEYFGLSSVRLSPYSIMTHTGVLDDSINFMVYRILWEYIGGQWFYLYRYQCILSALSRIFHELNFKTIHEHFIKYKFSKYESDAKSSPK